MSREIELDELGEALEELTYPATRADVSAECQKLVLLYDGEEEPFLETLDRIETDVFRTAEELQQSVLGALPLDAADESGRDG